MAIYNINGSSLNTIYDANGEPLQIAYNINGGVVYQSDPLFNIKVMSYNCGQWYTGIGNGISTEGTNAVNHRALLQSIMTAQEPDILCIQEYWDVIGSVTVRSLLETYFPYIQELNGELAYYGHAVCSKYPIENFMTSPMSSTPTFVPASESTNTNRYIDRCNITINGIVFTVFNTHFGLNTTDRANHADWLLSAMSGKTNVIACGDYNTACLSTSDADYTGVIQKFLTAGYNCANCSSFGFIKSYSDSNTELTEALDNVITSSNIVIDNAYIDTTKLTDGLSEKIDHVPFIAELSVY